MSVEHSVVIRRATAVEDPVLGSVMTGLQADLVGTLSGCIFSLPFTVILPKPDANSFTPYADLTADVVRQWALDHLATRPEIYDHLYLVLQRMVREQQGQEVPLPWIPE